MIGLIEISIPRMGSVENAKLVSWHVDEGGSFAAGDVLCEVETDKTLTQVEAEAAGILAKRLAAEGDELKVGDLIALMAAADATPEQVEAALARRRAANAAPLASPITAAPAAASRNVLRPDTPDEAAKLSPLVRRLAKEQRVDLASVRGTGPGGRITGDDVLKAASRESARPPSPASPGVPPGYESLSFERVPHSTRRRAIARRLADSARTAPHLTADMQVDLSALFASRERESVAGAPRVSLLSHVVHAAARLLRRHRDLNATFTEDELLRWDVVNIGIAVDTPDGLIVPVIRDADQMSLVGINDAVAELATRARSGTLRSEELEGGTFTVSNPGSLGPVLRAEAILNPPQVALLGLPGMLRAPVAIASAAGEYRVEIRPLLRPALTFDHRAIDGGHAIRFLNDFKSELESL